MLANDFAAAMCSDMFDICCLSFILTCSLLAYEYIVLKISLNQAVYMCLSNCITPLLIELKSCSSPQMTWKVFESAIKKIFFGFGLL